MKEYGNLINRLQKGKNFTGREILDVLHSAEYLEDDINELN